MKLDIRTKIIITLLIATCASLNTNVTVEIGMMIFIGGLQLMSGKKVFSPVLVILYAVFAITQYAIFPVVPGWVSMLLSMFVVNIRSFFPVVMCIVLIYRTTRISEVIATFTNMKVPRGIIITIAIGIRYIPALAVEMRAIWEAMSVRNVAEGIKNPFKRVAVNMECYIVPLFISSIKTADELSAAAMTRGIENPAPPTCRSYRKMSPGDFGLIAVILLFTAGNAYARYKGVLL